MAKPEWGIKRTCQACSTRFYDLMKSPITCPKCGAGFDPEAVLKSRRARAVPLVAEKKPKEAEDAEDGTEEEDEAETGVDELGNDSADNDGDDVDDSLSGDFDDSDDDSDDDDDSLLEDATDLDDDEDLGVVGGGNGDEDS